METTYTKVRIVGTPTLTQTSIEIDAADSTYSTTTNPGGVLQGHSSDWAVWGSAWDCVSGRGRDFTADLTGTPFSFDTSVIFNNKGYNSIGSVTCTSDGKICSGLKCGGFCGFCSIYQDIGWSLNQFISGDKGRTSRTLNVLLATLIVADQQAFAAGLGASPVTPAPSVAPILTCSDISKLAGLTPQQIFDECSKTTYCKAKYKTRKNKAKCKKLKCKKCKKNMACCNDNPEGCIYNPLGGKRNMCTDA